MVDLGQIVPNTFDGSVVGHSTKTVSPFVDNKDSVLVVTSHMNDSVLKSVSIAIKSAGKVFPVVRDASSTLTITCSTNGVLTFTNNYDATFRYLII